jgi:succinate dehydrogenase / fumarate reductase, cytochrome b subunit
MNARTEQRHSWRRKGRRGRAQLATTRLLSASVGKKWVIAVTGIFLMGYVFAHTFGNIKMYLGPTEINRYSAGLRTLLEPIFPRTWVLWIVLLALLAALALHLHATYGLTRMSRRATVGYQHRRDYRAANYASRTMRWTGPIIRAVLDLASVRHVLDRHRLHIPPR